MVGGSDPSSGPAGLPSVVVMNSHPCTSAPDGAPALAVLGLGHQYGDGPTAVRALDRVDLAFAPGTFTAVMGPSGSGKSTFLTCAAGLERPTSGRVLVDGAGRHRLGEDDRTRLRRERIGFVFQSFHLHALPDRRAERRPPARGSPGAVADRARVRALLDRVGLGGPRPAPARRAVRRPAAAGRDRAGAGRPAGRRARRRADRRPRLGAPRARCSRCCAERRRPRPDGRHGHPRPGRGVVRRPGRVPRRRPGRGPDGPARPPKPSPASSPTSTSSGGVAS